MDDSLDAYMEDTEDDKNRIKALKKLKNSHVYEKMTKSRKRHLDLWIKALEGDCDALIELSEKLKLY